MKFLFIAKQTLTLLFWVVLTFGFDSPHMAILTVAAALIHEMGHLFAIGATRRNDKSYLRADISGFRIKAPSLSYTAEIISALAGPFINLFVGTVMLTLFKNEYTALFGALNIMTAISNLLPIKEYDGYKALLAFASLFANDAARAESVLRWISFLLSSVLCFFSLFLMLKLGEGFWIFFVFFSTLLSEIFATCKSRQKSPFYEKKEDFKRF